MFTGIVQGIGRIAAVAGDAPRRLTIDAGRALAARPCRVGDSVSVSGACLTVVAVDGSRLDFELSAETASRTTLGARGAGAPVNLEPALRADDALGGHFVTGHVDGIARVLRVSEEAGALRLGLSAPPGLARFLAPRGSVALDGVSLTITGAEGEAFEVVIVPHTRAVTTLGTLRPGDALHLEVDLLARYLDRLLSERTP